MTDFHRENIVKAVLAALQGIRGTAGYYNTVTAQRYDRRESAVVRPEVTLFVGSETKKILDSRWDCTLTLRLEAVISADDDSLEGPTTDEHIGRLQDDVERALAGVDWTGLRAKLETKDTHLLDDPNDPEDGFTMAILIHYGHDEFDTRQPLEF